MLWKPSFIICLHVRCYWGHNVCLKHTSWWNSLQLSGWYVLNFLLLLWKYFNFFILIFYIPLFLGTNVGEVSLSFANMSILEIQKLLDSQLHDLSSPWPGTILFNLFPVKFTDTDESVSALLRSKPEEVNICDYIGGKMLDYKKLYFCPKTYPPHQTEK